MEKVVHVLGVGFSAPLGLPLISNFITLRLGLRLCLHQNVKREWQ